MLIRPGTRIRPQPELVAFDVDGTLLTNERRISERTRAALDRLRGRVALAVASARAPSELLPDILPAVGSPAYAIAYQGAWVGEWRGGDVHVLHDVRLLADTARQIALDAVAHGLSLGWFEEDEWWVPGMDAAIERHAVITGLAPHVDPATTFRSSRPHKLMLMAPRADLEDELTALASRAALLAGTHRSHPDYLEITATGVDKGRAFGLLAHHLGIPRSLTMAFGDGDNDVPLLAAAAHGVAMSSGTAAAVAAARWVTLGNDADGIAFALDAFFPSPHPAVTAFQSEVR